MLYIGTTRPIARSEWKKDHPQIWVRSLVKEEEPIRAHFSLAEVQYVGSTAGCVCNFPHVMRQGGEWPLSPDTDSEQDKHYLLNRQALCDLLSTMKDAVEIYGIWAGDYGNALICEEVSFSCIANSDFFFKERASYRVKA